MSSYPTDDGAFGTDTPIYNSTVGGPADAGLGTSGDTAYAAGTGTHTGTGTGTGTGTDASGAGGGKKDAAKEQARQVGSNAKEAGQHVAGAAKEQAGRVTGEARLQVRQLFGQATSELADQAKTQQQRLAQGVRSFGDEFSQLGQNGGGLAGDLAHTVSQRADSVASWLENNQPQDVLSEVRRFAARRPGLFLAIAAGTGVVAARLTKALVADAKPGSMNSTSTFSTGHDSTYPTGGDATSGTSYSGTQATGGTLSGTTGTGTTGTTGGSFTSTGTDDAGTYVGGATTDGSSLR